MRQRGSCGMYPHNCASGHFRRANCRGARAEGRGRVCLVVSGGRLRRLPRAVYPGLIRAAKMKRPADARFEMNLHCSRLIGNEMGCLYENY